MDHDEWISKLSGKVKFNEDSPHSHIHDCQWKSQMQNPQYLQLNLKLLMVVWTLLENACRNDDQMTKYTRLNIKTPEKQILFCARQ